MYGGGAWMKGPGVGGSQARTEPHTPQAGRRSNPSPGARLSPSLETQTGQRGRTSFLLPRMAPKLALGSGPQACLVFLLCRRSHCCAEIEGGAAHRAPGTLAWAELSRLSGVPSGSPPALCSSLSQPPPSVTSGRADAPGDPRSSQAGQGTPGPPTLEASPPQPYILRACGARGGRGRDRESAEKTGSPRGRP